VRILDDVLVGNDVACPETTPPVPTVFVDAINTTPLTRSR